VDPAYIALLTGVKTLMRGHYGRDMNALETGVTQSGLAIRTIIQRVWHILKLDVTFVAFILFHFVFFVNGKKIFVCSCFGYFYSFFFKKNQKKIQDFFIYIFILHQVIFERSFTVQ
jgi:hypothetical protein